VELRTVLNEWTRADRCRKPAASCRKRTTLSSVARCLWSGSCTAVGVGAARDGHSRMLRTGRATRSTSLGDHRRWSTRRIEHGAWHVKSLRFAVMMKSGISQRSSFTVVCTQLVYTTVRLVKSTMLDYRTKLCMTMPISFEVTGNLIVKL